MPDQFEQPCCGNCQHFKFEDMSGSGWCERLKRSTWCYVEYQCPFRSFDLPDNNISQRIPPPTARKRKPMSLTVLGIMQAGCIFMLYRNQWTHDLLIEVLDRDGVEACECMGTYESVMWRFWKWSRNPADWISR